MKMPLSCFLHEGIIEVQVPNPPNTSGENPRSVDRMTAAFMCRYPLGGGILEMHPGSRDQRMASSVERCFFLHIHGGSSWRHGAAEAWRQMCGDGHTQEVDAVWRRGGVGGS